MFASIFSNPPLVSVIIPAYNAEEFIEKTLICVLTQNYKNIEIIVVDDGSQDRTPEVVELMARKDSRVILLKQPNLGVAAARNLAIQKSRGEYIAPIDADDIWYPQNLEKQVQCMLQAGPSVGVVYAWSVDIDEEGALTGGFRAAKIEGKVYTTLVCHNFLGNASATLIRRACLEKVGGYNCKLKEQNAQGCEDWELYLRIAEHYQFRVVPEFLVGYRQLLGSMSCNYTSMAKSHELMLQDVRQKHPEIPDAIYRLSTSSFYMYLAQQSCQRIRYRITLFWLYKALQAESITPLLRSGLYAVSIRILFRIVTKQIGSLIWSEPDYFRLLQRNLASKQIAFNSRDSRKMTISDFKKPKVSLRLKLLAGSILHRSISIV